MSVLERAVQEHSLPDESLKATARAAPQSSELSKGGASAHEPRRTASASAIASDVDYAAYESAVEGIEALNIKPPSRPPVVEQRPQPDPNDFETRWAVDAPNEYAHHIGACFYLHERDLQTGEPEYYLPFRPDLVHFGSREEAELVGRTPCKVCQPLAEFEYMDDLFEMGW